MLSGEGGRGALYCLGREEGLYAVWGGRGRGSILSGEGGGGALYCLGREGEGSILSGEGGGGVYTV